MTFDREAVEAVAFDSYGTLVDVGAAADPLDDYVADPEVVARLWRNRSLGYAMAATLFGEYHAFYDLIGHALQYALEANGVEVGPDEREEILATYHELPAFDDVRDGLERLGEAGYDPYVVSNGNEAMLESMVEYAELGDLIEGTVSADEVERFKPAPEVYRHAADRIGAPVESIAFASAHWWDVPGALHAGMQGVWVNRKGTIWGPYDVEPDLTVETVRDVAEELGA